MKKILLLVMLALTTGAYSQNRNIDFKTNSLQEAFKLAKAQHKLIFVDCYTVWCVPCKGMDANVFNVDSVADFFNEKFISVKLDMEKGEGPAAIKSYSVGAFPTYLLFDENGKQIYKFVGGMNASEFMMKIRVGIDPTNEMVRREARYAAGDKDHAMFSELIIQKFRQKEPKLGQKISAEYFALLTPTEKLAKDNWFLFAEGYDSRYISNIGSENFSYLLSHYKDFVRTIGKETVDSKINAVYTQLAGNCMRGYYFKDHPFVKSEFEGYKAEVNKTNYPDKHNLLVLLDIAIAAGNKNTEEIGKMLAANLANFPQKNKDVVFDYLSLCLSVHKGYPYVNEIYDIVSKTSKNPNLIKLTEDYAKRIAVTKDGNNE